MINLNPVWKDQKFYIGTELSTGTSPTWTYSPLCEGIASIVPSVNETVKTDHFMCGNGGATNSVTAIAPQYTVTGSRVHGNTAQDYIAGLRYALGSARNSSMKLEIYDESDSLICTIIADCTITDIVDHGGNSDDNAPFSCILRVNGIPTVTTP